jgi:hypothetical protein
VSDDTAPTSSTGAHFCGECGASIESGATFCGECGSATSFAAGAGDDAGVDEDAEGASRWDGVETVVDRGDATASAALPPPTAPPVTVPVPNVPPPPGPATLAAPAMPPPGAPGSGGPEGPGGPGGPGDGKDGAKGNGPKILVGALVLVALLVAAFAFLGGGDDGDDEGSDTTLARDDEDPDDEDPDDETTTTAEGDTTTTDPGTDTTVDAGFVNLVDDTGRLTVDVPADWTDVSLAPDDGLSRILAATDATAFQTGFAAPGVDLRLLESPLAPEQFDSSLDTVANTILLPNSCTSQGKEDYTDGVFTGRMETWGECAEIGTQMVLLFASQADGQTVFLGLQLTAEDDPAIADRVLGSFLIVG